MRRRRKASEVWDWLAMEAGQDETRDTRGSVQDTRLPPARARKARSP